MPSLPCLRKFCAPIGDDHLEITQSKVVQFIQAYTQVVNISQMEMHLLIFNLFLATCHFLKGTKKRGAYRVIYAGKVRLAVMRVRSGTGVALGAGSTCAKTHMRMRPAME
ncbi:hypothetical protein POVWA2_006190 [Plasmodium ovale wallikeri]|uniref:Uncharacterized protein n=1 Tax=Plasmodium ovale wallikeri TaxID=864142 RepID=A0A1A8YJT8_PLAOA|nr:hypothetical protein POVWA2_006190 [Plasmodium ovale wallikeri]SBT40818.1 hypothetical protein POVWA1_042810 [Plasmodium ovale wallikeri]